MVGRRGGRVPRQVWLAGLIVARSSVMCPTNSLAALSGAHRPCQP
jgi:hypothetical protein